MHASSSYQNSGSKVTKIAIVTALHIGVALALINMKVITGGGEAKPPVTVTFDKPKIVIKPVETDLPVATKLPPLYVPRPETLVTTTADTVVTTFEKPRTSPIPEIQGPALIDAPPVPPKEVVAAPKKFEVASAGNCPVPNYPASSARNGDTGTVGLALLIAPDGHVADSRVTTSSGFRELDRAAVAALSSCRFKPATTNGVPESAWGKIAYVWTLE
jgi:protein TonB